MSLRQLIRVLLPCLLLAALMPAWAATAASKMAARPNILLVVLDDVGFSDLGFLGSEIRTPTLDKLAASGIVLTEFHATPNCSPTRAMLLSGTDSHIAGLGNMAEELAPNQKGRPGYEGYLNRRVAALPEVLRDAGYRTYMTGKWHLGLERETGPAARGFQRSFAMLEGGAGAFGNMLPLVGPGKARYREDGESLSALPRGFYSSAFYTERMIDYIESGRDSEQPFFAYLAYTAPHWPLQAPSESIARYAGAYDGGYDALRATRLASLQTLGLVKSGIRPFSRMPGEPPWSSLTPEQQRVEARKMEIYAAMVDDVDRYLGRLLTYLRESDQYRNTVVVVLSDNGPEAHHLEQGWDALRDWVAACCDNSYDNMGAADSYLWYGPNWGLAGNTPARMFKGFTSQGGVRVPALFHYPAGLASGLRSDAIISVMDVMPTLLELAGVDRPGPVFRGRPVAAMQGRSLLPVLTGTADDVRGPADYLGWELFGKRGLRQGSWKIIYEPYHEILEPRPAGVLTNRWQLYNLADDPAEMNDLAASEPERLARMVGLWEAYRERNGVILPDWASGY